jgi:putative tryptophan/tyrosine transport system substrate-binding protein
MRRRDVITLLGGAMLLPIRAAFPQADRMRRVGVLMAIVETDPQADARATAFLHGLRDLGWTEGRNLVIDMRWGRGQPDRIRALAAELVALKPDVIFAAPASAVPALQRETKTIPIVFAQTPDPVALGLVESLARPGGNITGFALYELAIGGKWLELLKQIAPTVARVAVLHDPRLPSAAGYVRAITQAAPSFGSEVVALAARNAAEIERVIGEFAREKTTGLIVPPSSLAVAHRELIIALAARHPLPAVYAYRYYVASGGLASYGIDNIPEYRQAAAYVDRILKGEKPGDLPVQYADNKFELANNLKTARTLGLEIPVSLLARTDEVIE